MLTEDDAIAAAKAFLASTPLACGLFQATGEQDYWVIRATAEGHPPAHIFVDLFTGEAGDLTVSVADVALLKSSD